MPSRPAPLLPCLAAALTALLLVEPAGAQTRSPAAGPRNAAADRNTLRLLPLGDAVLQSDAKHLSFRHWLHQELHASGYRVDFVGAVQDHQGGKPPKGIADPDHEGHAGWTTAQAAEQIAALAAVARPHLVLVHLGMHNPEPVDAAMGDLGKLIDRLRQQNPRVIIIFGALLPTRGNEAKIAAFNAALTRLAGSKQSRTAPLLTVELASGFDPAKLLEADGQTPNEAGERLLAERFFLALQLALDHEVPVVNRTLTGGLAPLQRFLRQGDYGGISAEVEEYMAGGRITGAELGAAAEMLDDLASYVAAQRARAAYAAEQKRYHVAGPVLDRLARQFRGVREGQEAAAQLAVWRKDARLAKELSAGLTMQQAQHARLTGRYGAALQLYQSVARQHAGTAAAAEAQRQADALARRGASK